MNRPKIFAVKAAIALGAFAAPAALAALAIGGASQAIASPDVCVSGPLGYASVCADVPIYGDWDNRGPRWHDDNGLHRGHYKWH